MQEVKMRVVYFSYSLPHSILFTRMMLCMRQRAR